MSFIYNFFCCLFCTFGVPSSFKQFTKDEQCVKTISICSEFGSGSNQKKDWTAVSLSVKGD